MSGRDMSAATLNWGVWGDGWNWGVQGVDRNWGVRGVLSASKAAG